MRRTESKGWLWRLGIVGLVVIATAGYCLTRANLAQETGGDSTSDAELTLGIYTDSNNCGTIEMGAADEYKKSSNTHGPGRVLCIDREGDGSGFDDLAEIVLVPPETSEGTVTLTAAMGAGLIRVWTTDGKSEEIELPMTWDLSSDTVPTTLYVDGIGLGNVVLELSYDPPTEDAEKADPDSIGLYVTDTISWSPTGYNGSYVSFWEPCWDLTAEGYLVFDSVKDHGWEVTVYFFKDYSGDAGEHRCTLENLRRMKEGGIVVASTHGDPGVLRVAYRDNETLANEWWNKGQPNEEPHMSTEPAREFPDHYRVTAEAQWFADNWAPVLNTSQAIVLVLSCYSAAGGTTSSVAALAGGRAGFGYPYPSTYYDDTINVPLLLNRLNGSTDSASKRTVGKAWGDGSEYVHSFTRFGGEIGKWTTINPAPNAVFPSAAVGGRKGAGCIIFDSYMDSSLSADLAVQKVSVNAPVSPRRWFANGSGNYLDSFDFDRHAAGSITLRAEADFCKNKKPANYGSTRKMSGDRQTYGEDKDWSF